MTIVMSPIEKSQPQDEGTYLPLAEAARRAKVSSTIMKTWAVRGSDYTGHSLRIREGAKGTILVAETDVAQLSKSSRGRMDRADRHAITINDRRYCTVSVAATMIGVTPNAVIKWLRAGSALGFHLEDVQASLPDDRQSFRSKKLRRLIPEETALMIADIRKHNKPERLSVSDGVRSLAAPSENVRPPNESSVNRV